MSEWKRVKLADYYEISSGLSKPASEFGRGYPFLSFSDVFWNFFVPKNLSQLVNTSDKERRNCSVKKGDVFLTRTSETTHELGMSCVALKDYENTTFNGFTKRLRPKSKDDIDPHFIGFYLRTPQFRAEITAFSNPTTRASLNNDIINRLWINLPSIRLQKKISTILNSYQLLIENNLKRIKLLEEMAQITYEEWFVRFKIDGVDLAIDGVTGLPFGWEKKSLSDLGDFLNGYAFKPEDLENEGMPIIKIKELKNGINNETPRNNGLKVPSKYIIENGDILFSWSASLEVSQWQGEKGLLNQHLFKVTPKNNVSKSLLYLGLKDALVIFNNVTTGATMKHIKRKELDFVAIVVPSSDVMIRFENLISPILTLILNLNYQNRHLKAARDLLLPRLMSGEIAIKE